MNHDSRNDVFFNPPNSQTDDFDNNADNANIGNKHRIYNNHNYYNYNNNNNYKYDIGTTISNGTG